MINRAEIIARLEKLNADDEVEERQLDGHIAWLRFREDSPWKPSDDQVVPGLVWTKPDGTLIVRDHAHFYTSSVDAALLLIPAGSAWDLKTLSESEGFFASVWRRDGGVPMVGTAKAATAAVAICIAALRATMT
jgi:hypothetical protein